MTDLEQPARTVAVAARSRSRFARLKLRYPGSRRSAFRHVGDPCFNAELSIELLERTGELPGSKRDLVALLREYRHALYALATQATNHRASQ